MVGGGSAIGESAGHAVMLGAAIVAAAAAVAAALVARSVRSDGDAGGDETALLRVRVETAEARLALVEKGLDAVGSRLASPSVSPEEVRAVAEDLRALRDGVRGELQVVDARVADLRRRWDEAATAQAPSRMREGPLPPEEEERWATLARDPDAGVRFSALVLLGRARTERSVQVSVDRLSDEDVAVAWQAVRNLGQFREKDAAAKVATMLDSDEAVLRSAAHQALLRMGAPANVAYEPTEKAEKRRPSADALRRWAAEQ